MKPPRGKLKRLYADILRIGTAPGQPDQSAIFFGNICDSATGQLIREYVWMKTGNWSKGILAGDKIAFDSYCRAATVQRYNGPELARFLSQPFNIETLSRLSEPVTERKAAHCGQNKMVETL